MSEKPGGKNPDKKSKRLIIIVSATIIITLLGIIVFLLTRGSEEKEKRNVVVTQDNVDEVVDDMLNHEYVEPGYYSASMSTTWRLQRITSPVNVQHRQHPQ